MAFYTAFLGKGPDRQNRTRFAQFRVGGTILSLFNPQFDKDLIASGADVSAVYSDAYLAYSRTATIRYGNNVVLNFGVDDLAAEYTRVQKLALGAVSDILYLNSAAPYYFFTLIDPDGNTLEITGPYEEPEED